MKGNDALQKFVFYSKYARVIEGTRTKETYEGSADRVLAMHYEHLVNGRGVDPEIVNKLLQEVEPFYKQQKILGAQRALQWGGEQLLAKHARMYNCASSYVDRVDYFWQLMYLLLAGAGVGYSVQTQHVSKLPIVFGANKEAYEDYQIPDSIEGWALSIQKLFNAHFYGGDSIKFNFDLIRPEGAYISGGFKAPGPEPLKKALLLCHKVLKSATGRKLTSVEASDLSCIIADSVIAGGVRRAALLALFSAEDSDFVQYKTGNWFYEHPYRARANVTAAVLPSTTKATYYSLFEATRQFGEPGIAFIKDGEFAYNPLIIAA